MFELFPDGPVYEYSQFVNITYAFAWSFALATLVAMTHRITFVGNVYPRNFFQSLVLGAIVTTMIMMAIGDSLARGLGVFGAMAIIRFRTRIEDPRDVLFLFAALTTGLAIGVYGFTIAFVGTLLFCTAAFLLYFSPFRSELPPKYLIFSLPNTDTLQEATAHIQQYSARFEQVAVQVSKENAVRYRYRVVFRKPADEPLLLNALTQIPTLRQLQLFAPEVSRE